MNSNVKKALEKLVPIGIGLLTIGQMVLSNHKDTVDRANMKAELKDDILKELTKK
mgnify:CR=1 FL=1